MMGTCYTDICYSPDDGGWYVNQYGSDDGGELWDRISILYPSKHDAKRALSSGTIEWETKTGNQPAAS